MENTTPKTNKWLKAKRAFTMIELLVVITIIGILVTIAIASFQTAQAKARDSRRKTDLDAFKKALELYKSDTTGGVYPSCNGGLAGPCIIDDIGDFQSTPLSLTPYFGQQFPVDPKPASTPLCNNTPVPVAYQKVYAGNANLTYCYTGTGTTTGSGLNTQYSGYTISACLENKGDQGTNTSNPPGNKCDNGVDGRTYGFTNP